MSLNFLSRQEVINSKDINQLKIEQLEILFNNSFEKLSGIASEHSRIKNNISIQIDEIRIAKKGNDFSTITELERKIEILKHELEDTQNKFHDNISIMEKSTKGFIDYLRNNTIKNYTGFQSLINLHKKLVELLDSKNKYDLISAFETLVADKKIFEDKSSFVNGKPAIYRSNGILRKKLLRWAAIAALGIGLAFSASGQSNISSQQSNSKEYHSLYIPQEMKIDSSFISNYDVEYYRDLKDDIVPTEINFIARSPSGKTMDIRVPQGFHKLKFRYSINGKELSVNIPPGDILLVYGTLGKKGIIILYTIFSRKNNGYDAVAHGSFEVGENDLTRRGKEPLQSLGAL